jgi:putative salt-induced outer membrane protein YdiY
MDRSHRSDDGHRTGGGNSVACILTCFWIAILGAVPALAQDAPVEPSREEERKLGWSNVADVGFVLTSGNTATSSLTLDDKLVRAWKNAELAFRFGVLRAKTVDDRFAVGTAADFRVTEDVSRELDNERYYVAGRYDRNITEQFFWVAGAGWDRDLDAGIANRSIVYGGLGNKWRDDDHTRFKTDYTATFTHRIDEIPDPERDVNYSEARLSWDYMHKVAAHAQFDSDFVFFVNVGDGSDYRINTIESVTSNLSSVMALRFSAQFLYQNLPALEEIDLYDTDGGRVVGTAVVRKKAIDTILKFSLVITF